MFADSKTKNADVSFTSDSSQNTYGSDRRSDIDWLRVLAVLLLVPFHAALVFDLNPLAIVYMKDSVQNGFLVQMASFINLWHMPLLFAIAGAATWFALGRRSSGRYIGERVTRLLVPAVFGVLVLVPLMTNKHWLGQPGAPSLGQIYSRFFAVNVSDIAGLGGTLTPAHLWFIWFLFLFSLLGLPLFLLLNKTWCQRVLAALGSWPGTVYLFFIPMALVAAIDILGDKNPLYYFLVFVSGYVVVSNRQFQSAINRHIVLSLVLALVSTIGSRILLGGNPQSWSTTWLTGNILYQMSRWTRLLFILGSGYRWLNRNNKVLRYATEAAYPFYIVHLPVLTIVSWCIIRMDVTIAVKYTLIVILTTLLTLTIYELVLKRVKALRFCFGMKAAMPLVRSSPITESAN